MTTQHTVDLDQEYEITAPVDYFGMKLRETIGTVFALDSREALRLARQVWLRRVRPE